jgi:hypothetical protein
MKTNTMESHLIFCALELLRISIRVVHAEKCFERPARLDMMDMIAAEKCFERPARLDMMDMIAAELHVSAAELLRAGAAIDAMQSVELLDVANKDWPIFAEEVRKQMWPRVAAHDFIPAL